MPNTQKLEWDEKYSVGVAEIDTQHRQLFDAINALLDAIETNSAEEKLKDIIDTILNYKKFHFETEEKYFKEFNYPEAEEHIRKHREFSDQIDALSQKYPKPNIEFAFALIDFLEDWLIDHLQTMDQKYVACFKEHGLK